MNFKKWVKSIQTAGYNGARLVNAIEFFGLAQNIWNVIYSISQLFRQALWHPAASVDRTQQSSPHYTQLHRTASKKTGF